MVGMVSEGPQSPSSLLARAQADHIPLASRLALIAMSSSPLSHLGPGAHLPLGNENFPDGHYTDPQLRRALFGSAPESDGPQEDDTAESRLKAPTLPGDDLCAHHYVAAGVHTRLRLAGEAFQSLCTPDDEKKLPFQTFLSHLRAYNDLVTQQMRARFAGQEDFGPSFAREMVPSADRVEFENAVLGQLHNATLSDGEGSLNHIRIRLEDLRSFFRDIDVAGQQAAAIAAWEASNEAWIQKTAELTMTLVRGVLAWNVDRPHDLGRKDAHGKDCSECVWDQEFRAKQEAWLSDYQSSLQRR